MCEEEIIIEEVLLSYTYSEVTEIVNCLDSFTPILHMPPPVRAQS